MAADGSNQTRLTNQPADTPELTRLVAEAGLERALQIHAAARAEDPERELFGPVAVHLLANSLLAQERSDDALALLELALAEFPESARLHWALAGTHHKRGAYDLEGRHIRRSLELDAFNTTAIQILGDDALEILDDMGLSEGMLNQLGYTLLRDDRAESAFGVFRLNVRRHPESANVYDSLAEAYASEGRTGLAIACYARVLELAPESERVAGVLRELRSQHEGDLPAECR